LLARLEIFFEGDASFPWSRTTPIVLSAA